MNITNMNSGMLTPTFKTEDSTWGSPNRLWLMIANTVSAIIWSTITMALTLNIFFKLELSISNIVSASIDGNTSFCNLLKNRFMTSSL